MPPLLGYKKCDDGQVILEHLFQDGVRGDCKDGSDERSQGAKGVKGVKSDVKSLNEPLSEAEINDRFEDFLRSLEKSLKKGDTEDWEGILAFLKTLGDFVLPYINSGFLFTLSSAIGLRKLYKLCRGVKNQDSTASQTTPDDQLPADSPHVTSSSLAPPIPPRNKPLVSPIPNILY